MTIRFYRVSEPYGCFSNFSRHSFRLEGRHWKTSEHYFQAMKFVTTDPKWAEKIRIAKSPREAADMGRDRSHPLRPDWEEIKDDVMLRAVLAKFTQNPEIRAILFSTDDEDLVEQTTGDDYWGCGTGGTGKNMLGKILMEVRDLLRGKTVTV